MQSKTIIYFCILIGSYLFQSCNSLIDDSKGTGSISVTMNGTNYDLTDVTGTEYLGFYCGGNILGKRMELALGQNPQIGDTLMFTRQTENMYPIYSLYNHNYGIPGSGNIIVTKRSGAIISGTFNFKIIVASDTLEFKNGSFNADFKPSR